MSLSLFQNNKPKIFFSQAYYMTDLECNQEFITNNHKWAHSSFNIVLYPGVNLGDNFMIKVNKNFSYKKYKYKRKIVKIMITKLYTLSHSAAGQEMFNFYRF